jgi:dienelactone hydrolase
LPERAEFHAHLYADQDDLKHTIVLDIAHEPGTGQYLAWDVRQARSIEDAAVIHGKRFDRELEAAPLFRGELDPQAFEEVKGLDLLLLKPYREAEVTMNKRTMRERLHGGEINRRRKPVSRDLLTEDMYVRVPVGYDPREPTGLVIWCNAGASGLIPQVLAPALDELNLICVGVASAGNDRPIADRVQLMLDARANLLQRFHIDPERVYMTGISGGGRVTSSMAVCFPEYIHGSVSIVGFSSYESFGRHPGTVGRPAPQWLSLAKERPYALVSGPNDFNYAEMRGRMATLQREGFQNMRFFSDPEMGHAMPKAEHFDEALSWVDAFYQRARQRSESTSRHEFDAYRQDRDDLAPAGLEDRDALRRIIEAHPWTEAARDALKLLAPDLESALVH